MLHERQLLGKPFRQVALDACIVHSSTAQHSTEQQYRLLSTQAEM